MRAATYRVCVRQLAPGQAPMINLWALGWLFCQWKGERVEDLTIYVLGVPTIGHPYHLRPLERFTVLYATATRIRVRTAQGQKLLRSPDNVFYLESDQVWLEVRAAYAHYQRSLDALADSLRDLGSYSSRLKQAGAKAPNPLSATVVVVDDPDRYYAETLVDTRPVPEIVRVVITRHTAQMWQGPANYGMRGQKDTFVCPDDAAWQHLREIHASAVLAASTWQLRLTRLGTYAQAVANTSAPLHGAQPSLF